MNTLKKIDNQEDREWSDPFVLQNGNGSPREAKGRQRSPSGAAADLTWTSCPDSISLTHQLTWEVRARLPPAGSWPLTQHKCVGFQIHGGGLGQPLHLY